MRKNKIKVGLLIFIQCYALTACHLLSKEKLQDKNVFKKDNMRCVVVNKSYRVQSVIACEEGASLSFYLHDKKKLSLLKADYQNLLKKALNLNLKYQGLNVEALKEAKITAWLGAPTFSPEELRLRAQVEIPEQNILLQLPFNPNEWKNPVQFFTYQVKKNTLKV